MGSQKFQCRGTTYCGKRCHLKRKLSDYCKIHEYQEKNVCSICFEHPLRGRSQRILECDHIYCKNCILQWMCKNPVCPLCRSTINDSMLCGEAVEYGIKNRLLIYTDHFYLNISGLSELEIEILELISVTPGSFMTHEEWEDTKTYIDPEIIEKITITHKQMVLRMNDLDEWYYYNENNQLYFFD